LKVDELEPAAHHRLLIDELEAVYRGETRRLMVLMPPGSAKTMYSSVLWPPWILAQRRNLCIIATSHTDDLAQENSRKSIEVARHNEDLLGFRLTRDSTKQWQTSNGGVYKAAGVGGPITGRRADIALIDDPVKDVAEAESPQFRNMTWNWYTSVLMTRLKPGGSVVLIMTRWHEDDLGGRLLDRQRDRWKVIDLKAQCLEAGDPLGRRPGEFLWSDRYGTGERSFSDDLADKKAELTESGALRVWEALFQQNPRPGEGALFQTRRIGYLEAAPVGGSLVRGWDLAATADTGSGNPDWTVGLLMQRTEEGAFIVRDVERFRGGPDRVEQMIVATAQADGSRVTVGLAQDPGAAGKAWNQHITKKLQGFKVRSSPETGDKATRAAAYASQVNAGNVSLVRGSWNHAYTDELSGFPSTAKDDQVDASSRAFNELIQPGFGAKVVRLFHMAR
jgi:predicted phage terminase large subunit-like protein